MNYDEPFKIFFDGRGGEWDDIQYVAWLSQLASAIKGLEYYNPEHKEWGQAHINAAWVIFKAIREGDPSAI